MSQKETWLRPQKMLKSMNMNNIILLVQHSLASVGPFFLLLGLLIFVHEMGHFAVAKFFGVRVEIFSLGFGKRIFQMRYGETLYCLSIIPLGGFVKMYGDDPSVEVPQVEKARAFLHKPVSQRIWIVLAGPLMNFIFAIFLLFIIALVGEQMPGTEIGDVALRSPIGQLGFRSGDKIASVDGHPVVLWSEVREIVEANAGRELKFDVLRGSDHVALVATPELADNESILSTKKKVGHIDGLSLESLAPVIGVRDPKGVAGSAGIETLDQIVSINGIEVHYFRELDPQLAAAIAKDRTLTLQVRHLSEEDSNPPTRTVTLQAPTAANKGSALEALGLESSELYLSKITKDSPAQKAGFIAGDRMTALNGVPLHEWKQVIDVVSTFKAGQPPLQFEVLRKGEPLKLTVVPQLTKLMTAKGQEDQRFAIGVYPAYIVTAASPLLYRAKSPLQALSLGFRHAVEMSQMVVMGLVRLVQNQVSARNIGGVISIGRFASQSFEMGLVAFLKMMALISINLFLLNLLPVPVLDGGHLVFFTIEAIKGAPLGLRKMEVAQQVGLVFLISLMVFAMFNDISNLIRPPW